MSQFGLGIFLCIFTLSHGWPWSLDPNGAQWLNPHNITISCGKTSNCTITCDEKEGCRGSTFNVFNNNIKIICSGVGSCRETTIISSNTKSLSMIFNGDSAFTGSYFGHLDNIVNVTCAANWGCSEAKFHFEANSAKQTCGGHMYSCAGAQIHALTHVDIICQDSDCSCYDLQVISSKNNDFNIDVTGAQYAYESNPIAIFLTSHENIDEIITCHDCKLDSIKYVHVLHKNGCFHTDEDCLQEIKSQLEERPPLVMDNYNGLTASDIPLYVSGDIFILFTLQPHTSKSRKTFIAPSLVMSEEEDIFAVFCMECDHMYFNFTQVNNVFMTSFFSTKDKMISYGLIHGPQNSFRFLPRSEMSRNKKNQLLLQNTAHIAIHDVGYASYVWIGDNRDLYFKCAASSACSDVVIQSALNPREEPLVAGEYEINCVSDGSCTNFRVSFAAINKVCGWNADGPSAVDCPFLYQLRAPSPQNTKVVSANNAFIVSDASSIVFIGTSSANRSHNESAQNLDNYTEGTFVYGPIVVSISVVILVFACLVLCSLWFKNQRKVIDCDTYVALAVLGEDHKL